jgi:hypothetical protein
MASAYQHKILKQFGLTDNEISNLDVMPMDPNADPIKEKLFVRNASGKTFFLVTHRNDPRYNGQEMCITGYVSNFCFCEDDLCMAFYKSPSGSLEVTKENDNYVCSFTPLEGKLFEITYDLEADTYNVNDKTIV